MNLLMTMLPLALLLSLISISESANILYVIPFSAKSHYIMLKPIGLELARRGHNVTVITTHTESNPPPNYRTVKVDQKEIWDVTGGSRPNIFSLEKMSAEEFHDVIVWKGNLGYTEMALNSTDVQNFLAEDNNFDIVVAEQFYNEAFNILAHKYKAPLVFISTFGNCMKHNIVTRNPLQIATTTSEFLDLEDPETFWGRLRNFYFSIYEYAWWKYWFLPENEKLVKKYIKNLTEPVPSLYEIQKNAALMLVNSHFSFSNPIAYLPNIVEIGGAHLAQSTKKIPDDLQKILDDATHGIVYVNFGSNVRSSELPIEKRNAFINVFKQLKQTVLWKWEDDKLENKPDNLVVRKWFPQKEILTHPNIKVFISHGGLIGTIEAVYNGVPIIGIPIFADQYNNLLQTEYHKFGKLLRYRDISEDKLRSLLHEVLKDNSYKENALTISKRFKDRPVPPLDLAVYWIEYVIKNKGADFIKNPALRLSWVEYNMLDIYGFILVVAVSSLFVFYKLVNLISLIVRDTKVKISPKKNQ